MPVRDVIICKAILDSDAELQAAWNAVTPFITDEKVLSEWQTVLPFANAVKENILRGLVASDATGDAWIEERNSVNSGAKNGAIEILQDFESKEISRKQFLKQLSALAEETREQFMQLCMTQPLPE